MEKKNGGRWLRGRKQCGKEGGSRLEKREQGRKEKGSDVERKGGGGWLGERSRVERREGTD